MNPSLLYDSSAPNRLQGSIETQIEQVPPAWRPVVSEWASSPAGRSLLAHLRARQAAGAVIYPSRVLRALELTPRQRVRVVILGQDPYHGVGQAEGLAFSVPPGQKLPPSLRNIYKELQRDLGCAPPADGHLGHWARQGVLLLNTSFTVEDASPASHSNRGWESLSDALVNAVSHDPGPKVFMLWGARAQARRAAIEASGEGHLILQSNHPSPLSATRGPVPFMGCSHFSSANHFILEKGLGKPINWTGSAKCE